MQIRAKLDNTNNSAYEATFGLGYDHSVDADYNENCPIVMAALKGCKRSIEKLYVQNKPLISYAMNTYKRYVPEDEIHGSYDMAFCKALKKFEVSKNVKFNSYLAYLLNKEVLSDISLYSDIYIPKKVRTMAFKVAMNLYHLEILNPSEMDIRYTMRFYNYDEKYYNVISHAVPLIAFQVWQKPNNGQEDNLDIDIDEADQQRDAKTSSLDGIHDKADLNKKLVDIIDQAVFLYCHPKEQKQMKMVLNAYMYSDSVRGSYMENLTYLLGRTESNIEYKLNNALTLLRDYLKLKGLTLHDFI